MPFKVRDLMIDVVPGANAGAFCRPCTPLVSDYCLCTNQITIDVCRVCTNLAISFHCGGCSIITPYVEITPWTVLTPGCGITDPRTPMTITLQTLTPQTPAVNQVGQVGMVANPQNLTELKAQLRQSLAQIEAQEQAMAGSMKPQTVEEANMLEQKLTEALDELRQHKEDLRRRSST